MKRKCIYFAIAANFLTIGWFLGLAAPDHAVYASDPDVVDMREVTDYEATGTGLMIYLKDGSGYYWERRGDEL